MDHSEAKRLLKVTKSELKKYCVRKMFEVAPELANSIDSKMLNDALIFTQGYACGIVSDIMPPYNSGDLKDLLLTQGFDYIKNRLSK